MTEYRHGKSNRNSYKRKNPRREARIYYWKGVPHQTLLFFILLFSFPALYFLIYGLIIEPNIPPHIYGPGDLMELIYLGVLLMIIGICIQLIKWINYQPIRFQIWNDLRLLTSLRFNWNKYLVLKRMGIEYKHRKRKSKPRKSHKSKPMS